MSDRTSDTGWTPPSSGTPAWESVPPPPETRTEPPIEIGSPEHRYAIRDQRNFQLAALRLATVALYVPSDVEGAIAFYGARRAAEIRLARAERQYERLGIGEIDANAPTPQRKALETQLPQLREDVHALAFDGDLEVALRATQGKSIKYQGINDGSAKFHTLDEADKAKCDEVVEEEIIAMAEELLFKSGEPNAQTAIGRLGEAVKLSTAPQDLVRDLTAVDSFGIQ